MLKKKVTLTLDKKIVDILDSIAKQECRFRSQMVEYAVCRLLNEKGLLKENTNGSSANSER